MRKIQAVTDHGNIFSGNGRIDKIYLIPQERYGVQNNEVFICPYWNEKRQVILDGTLENSRNMSWQQAKDMICYPQDSKSQKMCKCMKEYTNACGFAKEICKMYEQINKMLNS